MEHTFAAADLAQVWQSVAIATAAGNIRPILEGILIESYPGQGVRLTATDSFILITGWVPELNHDPSIIQYPAELDEAPVSKAIVTDPKGHVLKLMTWAAKDAAEAIKSGDPSPMIRLTIGDDQRSGFVLPGLDAKVATFDAPLLGKRFKAMVLEAEYPNWRAVWPSKVSDILRSSEVGFGAMGLLRFGQLSNLWGAAALRLTIGGSKQPVLVDMEGGKYEARTSAVEVRGLGMPVMLKADDKGITHAYAAASELTGGEDIAVDEVLDAMQSDLGEDFQTLVNEIDEAETLAQAADIVIKAGLGSTSALQRQMRVGFARAAALMDQLEAAGIVGPSDGTTRAREILVNVNPLRRIGGQAKEA